jgi:propionyl-CoA synthetase
MMISDVLNSHPSVAESAVIGIHDEIKGEVPLGLVVLKAGSTVTKEQIAKECAELVRKKIGPVACYKTTVIVKRLPKTLSGKILRGVMRCIANGEPYKYVEK